MVADATAGNGRDTLMLARQVGPWGRVYAFDIQELALQRTRELLVQEGVAGRVYLILNGHEHMSRHIKVPLAAVMFNLGYLPGGDQGVITGADTTVAGIREALSLLKPGGLVTIVIYTGHRGAAEEKEAVLRYCRRLDQKQYTVMHVNFINQVRCPPELVAIRSRP
ncbi:MAG TPA: methyltransferase domain-containing protein [Firmicutes bacterium]|nr:methyltransferase domain-containing protein [Bacillota bacterium]